MNREARRHSDDSILREVHLRNVHDRAVRQQYRNRAHSATLTPTKEYFMRNRGSLNHLSTHNLNPQQDQRMVRSFDHLHNSYNHLIVEQHLQNQQQHQQHLQHQPQQPQKTNTPTEPYCTKDTLPERKTSLAKRQEFASRRKRAIESRSYEETQHLRSHATTLDYENTV